MDELKTPPQLGEENPDEKKIIEDNLKVMSDFMEVMKERGTSNMDNDIIDKMKKMKEEWVEILWESKTGEVIVKEKKVVDDIQGAIPMKNMKTDKDIESATDNKETLETSSSLDLTSTEESEDESESSDEESGSASKQEKKTTKKKKLGKHKKIKINASSENEQFHKLIDAVQKFDNRIVPTPERFEETSGSDLKGYLKKFEEYCENNFKCSRNMWLVELEKFLSGRVLQALQIMRDDSESYEDTKKKLLEWFNNSKDSRKRKQKDLFKKMNYIKDESLYLYMARLEKQFKNAYPQNNVNDSKIIIKKMMSSLPRKIKGQMKAQIMSYKLNDKKIKWKTLKKWARYFDLEKEDDTSMSEEEKFGREVVITLGQRDGERSDDMIEVNRNEYYQQQNNNTAPRQNKSVHAQDKEQGFQRRYFTRPRNNLNRSNVHCNYCNRIGHIAADCRSRLKQCFGCGGDDHMIRNCPNGKENVNNYRGTVKHNSVNKQHFGDRKREHETHFNEKLNYQPLAQLREY